jgi:transcriptional regulator with XRE-family HTH domain
MADIADTLRGELRQEEFSEGYAESFLDAYIATQIKVLREQNELTQSQLAERLETTQTAISRIESVNYSGWNISTLKRLARAFNVRLKVSFETYGSLIRDVKEFNRDSLRRTPRSKDPELWPHERIQEQIRNEELVLAAAVLERVLNRPSEVFAPENGALRRLALAAAIQGEWRKMMEASSQPGPYVAHSRVRAQQDHRQLPLALSGSDNPGQVSDGDTRWLGAADKIVPINLKRGRTIRKRRPSQERRRYA